MNRWFKHSKSLLVIAGFCFSLIGTACAVSPQEKQMIMDAVPDKAKVSPQQPRKLLVFTLCKGFVHSSIPYAAEALQAMAQKTGAFSVVVSNDIAMFKPENLRQFDAVCFNNTTGELFDDPKLKQSLLDFVKGGKGIVGIHAATDCFYKWPEFGEMMGGYFDGHPWVSSGTWTVKIDDPLHPLMAAFRGEGFKINDEIYRLKAPYSRENLRVLMSLDMTDLTNQKARGIRPTDTDVGISWVRDYGKGRVFYCSLGHNHHIFWNPQILEHYLDGIQFALGDMKIDTTPSAKMSSINSSVTIPPDQQAQWDAALEKIKGYQFGQSREPLTVVADIVRESAANPVRRSALAERLAQMLTGDATYDCKQFLCRQLSLIGTEKQVPILARLLVDEQMSDMARYALERIAGPQADQALREALDRTSGKIKIGIINSLGNRGDTQAADAMIALLDDENKEIAAAAVRALGKIGGKKAARALERIMEKSEGQFRLDAADAYLLCADKFLAGGETQRAAQIYEQMYAEDEPQRIRTAALAGLVATGSEQGINYVLAALRSNDASQRGMAARLVRNIPGQSGTKAFAQQLSQLDPAAQVQLLSALADRADKGALPEVLKAADHEDASVRTAALQAIGKLGDDTTVELLARHATSGPGPERAAARTSLDLLRGQKVNAQMITLLESQAELRPELIRSLAARNAVEALPVVLKMTADENRAVRTASWSALRSLAGAENIAIILDYLVKADESDRREAEQTVVAVARRAASADQPLAAILTQLNQTDDPVVKTSLLRVLGVLGNNNALPVLRKGLQDEDETVRDTAIRQLSAWPTTAPMNDLLQIVQNSTNPVHRVLALRGYIDMIGRNEQLSPEQKLSMYNSAMKLADDAAQKKRVLAGISTLATFEALQTARQYLDDSDLQLEAANAVIQIAKSVYLTHPQQTKEIIAQVMDRVSGDAIQKQCLDILQRIQGLQR